jgi:glycosyltransferase involved in cell wall biosynthesis
MKKLLYIAPHLSTGGLPQYLLKKIQLLINEYEIYLVEWSNHSGGFFVVQRDQLIELLGDRFFEIGEDKANLFYIISSINPDIIHLEEFPEFFMDSSIAKQLYKQNRTYAIVETSHDSSFDPEQKQFYPDHFAFISEWHINQYRNVNIPQTIVYYPIEYKERPDRTEALKSLGLDPSKKHILHVGLFTPRKNQAEFFEYARKFPDVEFHCLGNQAGNFQHYWQPLMEKKPINVYIWGERKDVDNFYRAVDLFLFTSKGTINDKETMPLVIREALSWRLPTLIYNLPVYMNYWDQFKTIEYLDFASFNSNVAKIAKTLGIEEKQIDISKEAFIISTYPLTDSVIQTTKECIRAVKQTGRKVILTSHIPIPVELSNEVDYCINDNNNVLTKHTYYTNSWMQTPQYKAHIHLRGEDNDVYHGPACYTNYYNGTALAKSLGFKKVYLLNYDYILKDSTYIDRISGVLDKKDAFLGADEALEGKQVVTWFAAFKPDLFLDLPKVEVAQDYDILMQLWGAESNGYENLMYHAFKNTDNIHWEPKENFYKYTQETFTHKDYSRVEYFTVLPSTRKNEIVPFVQISNSNDSRTIKYILEKNGEVVKQQEYAVINKFHTYDAIPYSEEDIFKVVFEVYDLHTGDFLESKEIFIDKYYRDTKLHNNGLFEWFEPKIKLMHLVTEPHTNPKEIRSIENVKDFCDKTGIVYEQRVNEIWTETPPTENCARPSEVQDKPGYYKLAPGHYGCYLAHKNALLAQDNSQYDYILIFEGDVIIDSDYAELYESLKRFTRLSKQTDMDIIGFGNPWQNRNLNGPKVEDIYTDTTPFIPAQSYLINQDKIEKIVDLINSTPWDAFDLWVCNVAKLRVGIAEKIYTKHLPGFSIIEQEFKGTDENSPLIYAAE